MLEIFKKNKLYRDPIIISKRLNSQLTKEIISKQLENGNFSELTQFISAVMEYYIKSQDSKTNYTFEELKSLIYKPIEDFDPVMYSNNIIYANASNGYSKQNILKNGFSTSDFDKELSEQILYCEDFFSKSPYLDYQNSKNTSNKSLFFTLPGTTVVDYAIKLSPERLYMGILSQNYPDIFPYKIGEGKQEYFKRVIDYKVLRNNITNQKAIDYAYKIIEKLCSKTPIVNLFTKPDLKTYYNYIGNGDAQLAQDIVNGRFFSAGSADFINGGTYSSNSENMVTTDTNIKNIGIVNIPDYFELLEIKAKIFGFSEGEYVDIFTVVKPQLSIDNLTEVRLGGTGRMFQVKVYGHDYLYKPSENRTTGEIEKYRGKIQEVSYNIQKIVDPRTALPCIYIDNSLLPPGTIQPVKSTLLNSKNYKEFQNKGMTFSDDEIAQFMREFVTDYLLSNFDAHGGNFITTDSGILGIDKEQCFKYIDCNYLDINLNPNVSYGEYEKIYNTIFKQYLNNCNDFSFFSTIEKYINRIESLSDTKYIKIFEPYVKSLPEGIDKEELLGKILIRKKTLRIKLKSFFSELKKAKENLINTEENSSQTILFEEECENSKAK